MNSLSLRESHPLKSDCPLLPSHRRRMRVSGRSGRNSCQVCCAELGVALTLFNRAVILLPSGDDVGDDSCSVLTYLGGYKRLVELGMNLAASTTRHATVRV